MRSSVQLCLLSFIAIIFAVIGGGVYAYPDSVAPQAIKVLADGVPHSYHYPGLVPYLGAGMYAAAYPIGKTFSADDIRLPREASFRSFAQAQTDYDAPVRLVTIIFSVIGVISTYLVTLLLTGRRSAAFTSGIFLATAPLWVWDSHFATIDIPLASLSITGIAVLLWWVHTQHELTWRYVIFLGVLIGLATAAKYQGGLIGLAIAATILMSKKEMTSRTLTRLAACLGIALITFLIFNQGAMLEWQTFVKDFTFELNHAQTTDAAYPITGAAWLYHAGVNIPSGFGFSAAIIGCIGLIAAATRISRSQKLAFFIFPVVLALILGISPLPFARYVLPLLPFLAVGIGYLYSLVPASLSLRAPVLYTVFSCFVFILLILPNLFFAVRLTQVLSQLDTRLIVMQMLELQDVDSLPKPMLAKGYLYGILDENLGAEGTTFSYATAQVAIIDSFTTDRLISGNRNGSENEIPDLNTFGNGSVLILSPYTLPKKLVPYSPESIYGPYIPDIWHRARPGPYLELYARTSKQLDSFVAICGESCSIAPAAEGYYYQQFALVNSIH